MWPFKNLLATLAAPFRSVFAGNAADGAEDRFPALTASVSDLHDDGSPFDEVSLPTLFCADGESDGNGNSTSTSNNSTSSNNNNSNSNDDDSVSYYSANESNDSYQSAMSPPYTPLVNIIVGPTATPFTMEISLFSTESPAFATSLADHTASATPPTLTIESIPATHFTILTNWFTTHTPPSFPTAADLPLLVQLWVSASRLGLWQKANTLLRLGMETMLPATAVCAFSTVRWVFANTAASSPLRGYIVAIFVQRGLGPETFVAPREDGDEHIWALLPVVQGRLSKARLEYKAIKGDTAWGKDEAGGPVFEAEKMKQEEKLPFPEYLVWDDEATDVPDGFFLFPDTVAYEKGLDEAFREN